MKMLNMFPKRQLAIVQITAHIVVVVPLGRKKKAGWPPEK